MNYFLGTALVVVLALYGFEVHKKTEKSVKFGKAELFCLPSKVFTVIFDTEGNSAVGCMDGKSALIDAENNVHNLDLETRDI